MPIAPSTKPRHRLDDQARSNLSPTEHDVADADLAVDEVLTNPVVDALVASAQQAETVGRRQLVGECLVEPTPARAEQEEWPRRRDGFDGLEDRLRPHHHAGATTERRIVDRAMDIGRLLADVMASQIEQAGAAGSPQQALGAEGVDERGEE